MKVVSRLGSSAMFGCTAREPSSLKSGWKRRCVMKRGIFGTLVLSSFLVSTGRAQVGGSGTPNTIALFTTSTTIGDSPIMLSGGSIGIGANFFPQLPAKLFVVE